jgi:hypothetical protein
MKKSVIAGCAAFVLGCLILSLGMGKIMPQARQVSVRGLAEREVDADLAVWKLTFSVGGNDLPLLRKEVLRQAGIVQEYLKEHRLEESDYTMLSPEINDATMNMYIDSQKVKYNYIAKQSVLVRSSKVMSVKAAAADTLNLLGSGVSVTTEYDNRVNYEFTGLNAIKPEMIAQATENARLAAEQFAHDSGSKVGKIKTATQGLFSIENAAAGLEEKKNVRVVTTVVYSLK